MNPVNVSYNEEEEDTNNSFFAKAYNTESCTNENSSKILIKSSKNSSCSEKTYDNLNSEINKVAFCQNNKSSSDQSSNSISNPPSKNNKDIVKDYIIKSTDIWDINKTEKQTSEKYYKKFQEFNHGILNTKNFNINNLNDNLPSSNGENKKKIRAPLKNIKFNNKKINLNDNTIKYSQIFQKIIDKSNKIFIQKNTSKIIKSSIEKTINSMQKKDVSEEIEDDDKASSSDQENNIKEESESIKDNENINKNKEQNFNYDLKSKLKNNVIQGKSQTTPKNVMQENKNLCNIENNINTKMNDNNHISITNNKGGTTLKTTKNLKKNNNLVINTNFSNPLTYYTNTNTNNVSNSINFNNNINYNYNYNNSWNNVNYLQGSYSSTQYSSNNKKYVSGELSLDTGEDINEQYDNNSDRKYYQNMTNYSSPYTYSLLNRLQTNSSNESNNSFIINSNRSNKPYAAVNSSNYNPCTSFGNTQPKKPQNQLNTPTSSSINSSKYKLNSFRVINKFPITTLTEPSLNKEINLENIAKKLDMRTTLMIRNIPIKYEDKEMENELLNFVGKYNCLYLPMDYENSGNKGYAFINFIHPLDILCFYKEFEEKKWKFYDSKKICHLNYANFQGINEIKKHARNYKGSKRPKFYKDNECNNNNNYEIPIEFLNMVMQNYHAIYYSLNNSNKYLYNTVSVYIPDSKNKVK